MQITRKTHMTALEKRSFRNGLLFALPWIIGFLAFSIYPLCASFFYSFTKFNAITDPKWVGWSNYQQVFSDPLVWKALRNTLFMAFLSMPINLFVALMLASVVVKNFRGRSVVRTIYFLPSIIPMVAATMVWIWMFDPTYGYINRVLSLLGMTGPNWLVDARYAKWALLIMGSWTTGTTMLVCMAALQDVPASYYESASLDGANAVQKFVYITIPCIAHVLVYQAILSFINSFQYFQQVYVIVTANGGAKMGASLGGPQNSIMMYPLYIFHTAFTYLKMGKACAMAWILFVIVALLTVVLTRISKRVNENAGVE